MQVHVAYGDTGADHKYDRSRRVSDKVRQFDNKVVFVRGGAKGKRRSHAVRFAGEGDVRDLTDVDIDLGGLAT